MQTSFKQAAAGLPFRAGQSGSAGGGCLNIETRCCGCWAVYDRESSSEEIVTPDSTRPRLTPRAISGDHVVHLFNPLGNFGLVSRGGQSIEFCVSPDSQPSARRRWGWTERDTHWAETQKKEG